MRLLSPACVGSLRLDQAAVERFRPFPFSDDNQVSKSDSRADFVCRITRRFSSRDKSFDNPGLLIVKIDHVIARFPEATSCTAILPAAKKVYS